MNILDKDYYINGKKTSLPLCKSRYISRAEFRRVIDLLVENYRLALKKAPELEQIIKDFDGKPAKAAFKKAATEHGFRCEESYGETRIYMPLTSNCILADDGKSLIGPNNLEASRDELENGIRLCSFLQFDEEGLLDADKTLEDTDERDTMQTDIRWAKEELSDLTSPAVDEYIEKMYQARTLLLDIYKNAPECLRYRLSQDLLSDAAMYD